MAGAVGAGFEEDGGALDGGEGPIVVGGWVDGALFDDVADDDVAVGVGAFENDNVVVDIREVAAAAGAVVVGGDDELLGWVDRLAVMAEVLDAAGVWIDGFAFGVVFGGLAEVDLVGDAVDDIEIVGWESGVDERLVAGVGGDLVELAGGHFEPFFDLGAGDRDGADGVGVEVEVGDIFDRDRAWGDIGVVVGAAAATGFEGCGGGEDRQAGPFGALQHLFDVPGLGLADDLHGGVVGDEGEVGVEWGGGFADGAADIGEGFLVFGRDGVADLGDFIDEWDGLPVFAAVDRAGFAGVGDDGPAVTLAFEEQVDEAEVGAPEAGHDGGFTHDGAGGVVEAGEAVIFGAGEIEMAVAGEDGVDAIEGSERNGGVFHAIAVLGGADAGMG